MSYKPNLKELEKKEKDRVANLIVSYIKKVKERQILYEVKIRSKRIRQRKQIMVSLRRYPDFQAGLLIELKYDFRTPELEQQVRGDIVYKVKDLIKKDPEIKEADIMIL